MSGRESSCPSLTICSSAHLDLNSLAGQHSSPHLVTSIDNLYPLDQNSFCNMYHLTDKISISRSDDRLGGTRGVLALSKRELQLRPAAAYNNFWYYNAFRVLCIVDGEDGVFKVKAPISEDICNWALSFSQPISELGLFNENLLWCRPPSHHYF